MLNIKNFLLFFIFLFLLTKNSYSENNVAYLNLDFVLSNSNSGKILLRNLKIKKEKIIEEFKNKEKNLKDEENKILASRTIISEEVLNQKIAEFKKKLNNYKEYKSKEIDDIKQNRNKEITKLINLMSPIIENFMRENSISIVLDKKNIFIADQNYDITNKIISEINKSLK